MKNMTSMERSTEVKRLLIIDDEENMRHMLSAMLKRSGYTVDTASDGLEGIEKVEMMYS